MFGANRCPFLRTIVWISDSKLLQFINLEYYAFDFLYIRRLYSILEDFFFFLEKCTSTQDDFFKKTNKQNKTQFLVACIKYR